MQIVSKCSSKITFPLTPDLGLLKGNIGERQRQQGNFTEEPEGDAGI